MELERNPLRVALFFVCATKALADEHGCCDAQAVAMKIALIYPGASRVSEWLTSAVGYNSRRPAKLIMHGHAAYDPAHW